MAENTTESSSAWLAVSDQLLWGFNHALSNRLAAISSLVRILEYSETGADPLLEVLTQEVVRLENTLRLLRLLPRNPHPTPEGVRFEDLVPEVIELQQLRSGLAEVTYTFVPRDDPPAVWLESSHFIQALLLLLDSAAKQTSANGTITIASAGDEEFGYLTISGSADVASEVFAEETKGRRHSAQAILQAAGGDLTYDSKQHGGDNAEDVSLYYRCRFPTLMAVRKASRG